MDTERLGRVLGVGARHAAKTLVGAVDAATSPSPTTQATRPPTSRPGNGVKPSSGASGSSSAARSSISTPLQRAEAGQSRRGLAEGGRRFGRAVWEPAARLSGVLWLEVTGLFFGIFVLVAGAAAWRLRGALHTVPGAANARAHTEFLMALGMLLLFGYFAVSSFVAASRRSRRR